MFFFNLRPLTVAGSLFLTIAVGGLSQSVQAHPPTLPIILQESFDPPGDDAPDRTVGAGSRINRQGPGDVGARSQL